MTISHIVATSKNNIIGNGGALPWHIPADFKFFKSKTMGCPIIMGRKTYESIGKPLPGRLNIVISRKPQPAIPGVVAVSSIEAALAYCQEHAAEWKPEIFIVGGGEIYRQTLPLTDKIYLTRIDQICDGDTSYPEIDEHAFALTDMQSGGESQPSFEWLTYERRSPR